MENRIILMDHYVKGRRSLPDDAISHIQTNEKVLESAMPWSSTCRQLSSKQFWAAPSI
jgi:hypothetical protein